jgi:hypothetical protein
MISVAGGAVTTRPRRQEPILRLLNLQLQRELQRSRCSWLERFFEVEGKNFETHWATRCGVNFYSAGVVTRYRRNGS